MCRVVFFGVSWGVIYLRGGYEMFVDGDEDGDVFLELGVRFFVYVFSVRIVYVGFGMFSELL